MAPAGGKFSMFTWFLLSFKITGKGFTGTYRLMHPYFPAPKELWGEDFVEKKEKEEKATPKL